MIKQNNIQDMKIIEKETYIHLRNMHANTSNADFAALLNKKYRAQDGKKFNKHSIEVRNHHYGLKGLGDQRFQEKDPVEIVKLATTEQLRFFQATKDFGAFKKRVLNRLYDLKREPDPEYKEKIRKKYINHVGIKKYRADAVVRMRKHRKKNRITL